MTARGAAVQHSTGVKDLGMHPKFMYGTWENRPVPKGFGNERSTRRKTLKTTGRWSDALVRCAQQRIDQESLSLSGARMRSAISKGGGNASSASCKGGGQGVRCEAESEGFEEKYRAVINGGCSNDEPVGQRWGKVEPALWGRRRSHPPIVPRCLRTARYGRPMRDLRRPCIVPMARGRPPISESEMASRGDARSRTTE